MKAAEDSYMCIQNDTCSSGKENHNVECNPVWLTKKTFRQICLFVVQLLFSKCEHL